MYFVSDDFKKGIEKLEEAHFFSELNEPEKLMEEVSLHQVLKNEYDSSVQDPRVQKRKDVSDHDDEIECLECILSPEQHHCSRSLPPAPKVQKLAINNNLLPVVSIAKLKILASNPSVPENVESTTPECEENEEDNGTLMFFLNYNALIKYMVHVISGHIFQLILN